MNNNRINQNLDHFIVDKDGAVFAGHHIIIDIWGAEELSNIEKMREVLITGVEKCRATLLHIHLHHFEPNNGISGVAVLAESHVSVHTWPETKFGAFDVFMCGDTDPMKMVDEIKSAFNPEKIYVKKLKRGEINEQ
jgi:S-adenosylmethionine decarboxylase